MTGLWSNLINLFQDLNDGFSVLFAQFEQCGCINYEEEDMGIHIIILPRFDSR